MNKRGEIKKKVNLDQFAASYDLKSLSRRVQQRSQSFINQMQRLRNKSSIKQLRHAVR